MSFFVFRGDLTPSQVELEDTDTRFRILLIIFIVQITISKMVSFFDRCKITTFFHIIHLYTKLFFQSFHCTFRDVGELGHLSVWITLPQKLGVGRMSCHKRHLLHILQAVADYTAADVQHALAADVNAVGRHQRGNNGQRIETERTRRHHGNNRSLRPRA